MVGVCMAGGMHNEGAMRGRGACMTREGAYVAGGCVAGGVHGRGACVGAVHAGNTATEASGTHPTGTLSC